MTIRYNISISRMIYQCFRYIKSSPASIHHLNQTRLKMVPIAQLVAEMHQNASIQILIFQKFWHYKFKLVKNHLSLTKWTANGNWHVINDLVYSKSINLIHKMTWCTLTTLATGVGADTISWKQCHKSMHAVINRWHKNSVFANHGAILIQIASCGLAIQSTHLICHTKTKNVQKNQTGVNKFLDRRSTGNQYASRQLKVKSKS